MREEVHEMRIDKKQRLREMWKEDHGEEWMNRGRQGWRYGGNEEEIEWRRYGRSTGGQEGRRIKGGSGADKKE